MARGSFHWVLFLHSFVSWQQDSPSTSLTQIGVPVSSSQAVVGAVVEVGFVGGMRTVSGRMLARIVTGWALAPVAAGILSVILTKCIT